MRTFVFVGPTITRAEAERWLDAIYLPPVSQGDIVSLLRKEPEAIGIIDGYFDSVPAVWHKEILLALSRGVHVAGAASMGALRAAELHSFGMVGVGEIFEWYRDGVIEADDEVAVHHGPAEFGYPAFSEPLVNIRKTLDAACEQGLITPSIREQLITIGEDIPYWERSYARILEQGRERGLPERSLTRLQVYLEENATDLKRSDAIQLLRYLSELPAASRPAAPAFDLQHTVFLSRLEDRDQTLSARDEERFTASDLVTHARLELDGFPALKRRAAMNSLVLDFARHLGVIVSHEEIEEERVQLQLALGLSTADDFEMWRARNDLTEGELAQLVERRAIIRKVMNIYGARTSNRMLLDQLRIEGQYEELVRTMREKASILLRRTGREELSDHDLWQWYFARKGLEVPDDTHSFAAELGFHDYSAVMLALEEHYYYHRLLSDA